MFERFSESARRVIFLARFEALQLHSPHIDLPHLALGFILADQGEVASRWNRALDPALMKVLNRIQRQPEQSFLDYATAAELYGFFSNSGPSLEAKQDLPLTKAAKASLSKAGACAGDVAITPLHLLWALIAEENDPVAQRLVENGVTQHRVEEAIQSGKFN